MRKWFYVSFMIVLMIGLCACEKKEQEEMLLDVNAETVSVDTTTEENIWVYVCGAVAQEGVYELPEGSRIYEAIDAAGGFLSDAEKSQVNQAEILSDEMTIYVPKVGEAEKDSQSDGKINLNQATKEQLMTLPGVGESRAESIIAYRETHGKFKKIEEIMNISGIKEALFDKIKDRIKI